MVDPFQQADLFCIEISAEVNHLPGLGGGVAVQYNLLQNRLHLSYISSANRECHMIWNVVLASLFNSTVTLNLIAGQVEYSLNSD